MVSIDDVIKTYITLRNKRDAIKKAAEAEVREIDNSLSKLEAWVKEQADEAGVTSFKSPHGTAFLNPTDYASVSDWDKVLEFVQAHSAYDLLTKGVSKTAVRGFIEQHKQVPPGVTYGTRISVQFRKPTKKVDDE